MRTLLYFQMILISINCGNFVFTGALGEKSEFGAKLEENGKIPDETEILPPGFRMPNSWCQDARP